MKIALLDFNCNSVDIIDAENEVLSQYNNTIDFLTEHCGYDPENIQWISGDDLKFNLDMTDKSFG